MGTIIKVKSNEELFNKIKNISFDINVLAGLVQNDYEIDSDVLEFMINERFNILQSSIDGIENELRNYLLK